MGFRVVWVMALSFLTGCSSMANDLPDYEVLETVSLSKVLEETSGLYCPENGVAYTINDSGNQPVIYKIDGTGTILSEQAIDTKMRDWEALTGDKTHFFIGDIGNNHGKRKFVQIHALPKQASEATVTTSRISYIQNSVQNNEFYNHDFDAEALVSQGDKLFLFSKSWETGTLLVYQLNKDLPEQSVEAVASVENLPGMITGADYDQKNQRFILVGYVLRGMGGFYPFISILNKQFELVKSLDLKGFDQVEGVCVTPNSEVWFTQEGGYFSSQKLVKLKLNI